MTESRDLDNAILRTLLAQTTEAYERQVTALAAEKEIAQVTLASIADAVIATDRDGRVSYLNPAAEGLLGITATAADGRPLARVVRLFGETDGERYHLPVARWLRADDGPQRLEGVALEARHGGRCAVQGVVSPIRDAGGSAVGLVLVLRDVSAARLLALQLAHQASHDQLTGIMNRQAFEQRLRAELQRGEGGAAVSTLCYMDLDQFKIINDTCGHMAGDELLRRITGILKEQLREEDVLARLGGDEFAVLLVDCPPEVAEPLAVSLCGAVRAHRFAWEDKVFGVSASMGMVRVGEEFAAVADILRAADHACYLAKEKGGDRVQLFEPGDREMAVRLGEMQLVVRLQRALDRGEFVLFAQPLEPLSATAAGRWAFEVLVRLTGREGALYPPAQFIRAAERYGLMQRLDRWVVEHTLVQLAELSPATLARLDRCFINLSGMTLSDEGFPKLVAALLARYRVPAERLCFEVTETAAVQSIAAARRMMDALIALGCRFALDDFGQGMSSYGYLKTLPVSYVKIDGIFIKDMVSDPLDRAMVESINQMGHLLGLETVAETVSSETLLEAVREVGVDWAQGFQLARPRPLDELLADADASSLVV